jgi:hypothetical protein
MSRRTSLYLGDHAETALGPLEADDSLSGRINTILIRYDQIRIAACPDLTEKEWLAICDANNGTWLQADHAETDPARHLWMNVADDDELDEKWGIDRLELARRMKGMSVAEQCAVIEVVGRFWRPGEVVEGETYAQLLARSGAKITP